MRKVVLMLSMVVVMAGCARNARPASQVDPTFVEVDNRRFADMVIYAIDGSRRIRIGTATGNVSTKLRIPTSLVGKGHDVQFLADPIGGQRTGVSQTIYVQPGDTVKLTILP